MLMMKIVRRAESMGLLHVTLKLFFFFFLAAEGRMPEADRHGAERDNKRRKKKPRSRKPWELGSEGEETSDGSSTEKVRGVFCVLLANKKIHYKLKNTYSLCKSP